MALSGEGAIRETDGASLLQRGTLEQADGNHTAAESLFRDALHALEHASVPDEPARVAALRALGQLLVARGALEEAEPLLIRALEFSESPASTAAGEVPILLRELSRLYILQSAHERAEQPLVRLLATMKERGDGRPEVATVLASLAGVHHALGDYASAEREFRQALNIRERTLAPNHITIAATMESLAETCAARGHFGEGVSLCSRALSIREHTLGAHDASVLLVRQRIADLQLEAQEESRVAEGAHRSTPARSSSLPANEPPRERTPSASRPAVILIPHAAELSAVWDEIERTASDPFDRTRRRSAITTAIVTRPRTAIAVAAGLVVVLAVLAFQRQGARQPERPRFVDAEPFNPATQSGRQQAAAAALTTPVVPASLDTIAPATATPSSRDNVASVSPPVASRAKSPAVVPIAAGPSASRNATAPPPPAPTPAPTQVTAQEVAPAAPGNREPVNAPVSPTLIGTAPQPTYPDALRELQVEGEVVVQFVVDETGRPDVSSMTVVRSPHLLLTNAVRVVLPQFRFEPARTAPPQSIPRPETVRRSFTFRAPPR